MKDEEIAEEWWNNWVVKDWNDLQEGKRLFIQAFLAGLKAGRPQKENRKVKYCYLCGASRPEFTVASKHLSCMLERFKKFDSGTSHITIHICEDCFLKAFDKEKEYVSKRDI